MRLLSTLTIFAVLAGSSHTAFAGYRSNGEESSVMLSEAADQCVGVSGYLVDSTPGGRSVFARPDTSSASLGSILEPEVSVIDGVSVPEPVGFEIRAGEDGWLFVSGAADDPVRTGRPARSMYPGEGWIRGEGVSVNVQSSQGFGEPSHESRIIIRVSGSWLDVRQVAVLDCQGNWVKLRWRAANWEDSLIDASAISEDQEFAEAWVTGICNNPDTTCDGLSGNRP